MRFLLLNTIRLYWFLIPKKKRRKCIFKKSCSNQVYDETKRHGLFRGMHALNFRIQNCKPDFDVFTDPFTGKKQMLLKSGTIVEEDQIAERLR